MFRFAPCLALCLAGMPALAQSDAVQSVLYRCERGARVPVTFITPDAANPGFAVAQIDGQQIAMEQVTSGSGIRYRAIAADLPYEFHGKGSEAMFAYGPDGDSVTVLADCIAE